MKKLLFALFVIMLFPVLAVADDSGTCGINVNYSYVESTKTLTIFGDGDMNDMDRESQPWKDYRLEIESIVIEEGVKVIGEESFVDFDNLKSISLPNSLTAIHDRAFQYCIRLESLVIPENVISYGSGTFYSCGLKSIVIGRSVQYVNGEDFANTNLTSISVQEGNEKYDSRDNCNAIIRTSTNSLWVGCRNTIIPTSVNSIGSLAFNGVSINNLSIPESVTTIEMEAFKECRIDKIIIPKSVTSIGMYAFINSTIREVVIEGGPSIGSGAFLDCQELTSISFREKLSNLYSDAFDGCSKLFSLSFPEGTSSLDISLRDCASLTSIYLPSSMQSVSLWSFQTYCCFALKDVYCYAKNPPALLNDNPNPYSFNAILHVPFSSLEFYKEQRGWNGFKSIVSIEPVFHLNYYVDGELYKSFEKIEGMEIVPEEALTKEGYSFSWGDIPQIMPAHNVDVTGTFSVNSYSLTYKVDNAEYKTMQVPYGTKLTPEAEPSMEGFTFSGWYGIPVTMPAHDVVVTGSFTVNSYTLTYKVDGEEYKTMTVPFGIQLATEPEPVREGYTFSGWSETPATMPAHDVVVTGSFTINSYTLTYKVDDEEYKTMTVPFGTQLTPEVEPVKEGFTFSGWSEIPKTMPANDVVVTGTFSKGQYTLKYVIDGEEYKTIKIDYNDPVTPEANPVRLGYTFSGWSEIPATMPAHDVVVTGTFSVNSYTLTYKVDDEDYKTMTVAYGTELTPEAGPTKEGYTFSGWSEIPATMPAHDVVVTGTFSVNSYTLTYKVDDEEYKTMTVVYGTELIPEAAPVKEGYTFSGWSEIPATMPAHDVVVTGTFSVNSYTLTYKVDDEEYKTMIVAYGTELTPEAEPTKEGYTFSGWSEMPETMPAHDLIVTGTFSINSYTLTYMVDDEVYKTMTVVYGAELIPEDDPTKEHYTFSGWSEIPATMPAHDVVVTGTFIIDKYKLTYIVDGEVYKMYDVEYGATITPEAEPVKEGYTFSGWTWIPSKMPAEDVVVTGTFAINNYKLTYMVDNELYKTYEVEYGATITAEPEPEEEGYTFSGWSWIPQIMPAEDVTVSGSFSVNSYQVIYVIAGEIYKTEMVEYGAEIVLPEVPEREGYSFVWTNVPETMPAHDIVILGEYTSGIEEILMADKEARLYNMKGRRILKPERGVNIIRMGDGTIKKVIKK